jgi:Flp pilus assembly pilin Flp
MPGGGVMRRAAQPARPALRGMLLALACAPAPAFAHAFGARYELPVPVWLFIVGGALTVTLTFVMVAAFARAGAERYARTRWQLHGTFIGRLLSSSWTIAALKLAGVVALALIVTAGFIGTRDPNRNIAPTLVWIVWWIGFSYVAMLVGNLWPVLNPWRTLYDRFAALRPGRSDASRAPRPWPARLGSWPALAGLLALGWVELVFPFRATPVVLSWLVICYSAITWAGMARYGAEAWLRHADPFYRVFELFSRFAPFVAAPGQGLVLRPHAAGLLQRESAGASAAEVGFILAMLAIVLFDGFQGSKHWVAIEDAVHAISPKLGDAGWILLHSVALLAMWIAFLGLYLAACALARAAAAAGGLSTLGYARAFAPTLIPIAVGYHFAHSFTNLLVQGQSIIFLVSDPFGLGWNLFGTRDFEIDIALIRTRTAWYVALGAIVAGHAISVYLAHAAAERLHEARGRALRALAPMTALMVLYTIISLQILAEPLVRYSGPQETII